MKEKWFFVLGLRSKLKTMERYKKLANEFLFETAVIIIGISISFYIDRVRENAKDQNTAQQFYIAVKEDILIDRKELSKDSLSFTTLNDALNYFSVHSDNLEKDSSDFYITRLPKFIQFYTHSGSYQSLKFSGDLNVIDKRFKDLLVNYYENVIPELAFHTSTYAEYSSTKMRDYLDNNLKYPHEPNTAPDINEVKKVISSNYVQSFCKTRTNTTQRIVLQYQAAIKISDNLISQLDKLISTSSM